MTLHEAVLRCGERLEEAGIEEASSHARMMAMHAAGIRPAMYILQRREEIPDDVLAKLDEMTTRRCAGEPVQHILGTWEFAGLVFRTDTRALIPRMETEMLVEEVCRRIPVGAAAAVADVGTGTGCVGLSIAHARPGVRVVLMDVSEDALSLAEENRDALGIRAEAVRHDMRSKLPGGPYDIIVSNPPYIPTAELPGLQREVQHDPVLALDGGEDGLWAYRALAERMDDSLRPGGWMIAEIGHGQGSDVRALFSAHGGEAVLLYDLDGHERVVLCQSNGGKRNAD